MGDPDVVVVGSGVAGLTAALVAVRRGARTVVLEAAPVVGGTSAISGGTMWIPGNRFEAGGSNGGSTSVETYLRAVTLGLVPEEILQSFIELAPAAAMFIEAETGLEFEHSRVPDYHTAAPGASPSGRGVAATLFDLNQLGEHRALMRPVTAGGIPAVTHAEARSGSSGALTPGALSPVIASLVGERAQQGVVGRGNALIAGLFKSCLDNGVEFECNARVLGLEQDGDRVIGVKAEEGRSVRARLGVVLASGGFEWNRQLWNGLLGKPLDCPLSPPYNRGDALVMAMAVGAGLAHTSMAWWMPSITVEGEQVDGEPAGRMFTTPKGLPGAVVVNRRGRRFANESMNYHDFGTAMTSFDPHSYSFANLPAWVILDDQHSQTYGIEGNVASFGDQWLSTAPTLKALAQTIGVDPNGLEAEIADFNRHAERHLDPKFNRGESPRDVFMGDSRGPDPCLRPLEDGPYHAYRLSLGCLGTKGGAVIDGKARVLDVRNNPIPGLFAVGNAAASVFGPAYPGNGATLGAAAAFGYAAGLTTTN